MSILAQLKEALLANVDEAQRAAVEYAFDLALATLGLRL